MQAQRKRRKPMAEINVVPYIDVMLVLLIVFMVTTPLLTEGVKVNLPQAAAKTVDTKEQEPIVVSVDAKGLYYLNINSYPDTPMAVEDLATRIAAELELAKQSGKQRDVLVKGDKDVDYGKVMQAMVLLQQAGADAVGLITSPPPKS
ncbi:MAG: tolR [Gammaproteobacteria bacterium]|jgi:biopolymer transport protein TolR|nr:tolR [Gammaproteobacteria bacterium]